MEEDDIEENDYVFIQGDPIPVTQEEDNDDFVFISGKPVSGLDDVQSASKFPELTTLTSHGETELIEFKRETTSSKKMAKEVAAIANLAARSDYGEGYLIIGVTDDGKAIGVDDPEKAEEWIAQVCAEHIEQHVNLSPRVMDESVLAVRVSEASVDDLLRIDGRVPIRTGTITEWFDES